MVSSNAEGMTSGRCARAVAHALKGVEAGADVATDALHRTVAVVRRADQLEDLPKPNSEREAE